MVAVGMSSRRMRWIMVGCELIDCIRGEVREIGAEPVDRSAERVTCDVENDNDDGKGLGNDP